MRGSANILGHVETDARLLTRAAWHARASVVVYVWFAAAIIVVLLRDHIADAAWLSTHLLLLGAVTNAIFIWSWHFTAAILRVPTSPDRAEEILRLAVLNAGVGGIIIGGLAESPFIVIIAAGFVATAVVLLARAVLVALRHALPSPYAFTAQAYVVATSLLLCGIVLGVVMETVPMSDALHARLMLAHVACNVLGWVGITILGTIVTLWPTMLRTRIAPNAARLARRVLPVLAGSTIIAAIALALRVADVAAIALLVYAGAFVITGVPIATVMRAKRPTTFATQSALAGLLWLAGTVVLVAIALLRWGIDTVAAHGAGLVIAGAAGVLQVLIGCMAYLLPAMAGGGPAIVRLRNDRADRGALARLTLANVGVALVIAAPDGGRTPGVLVALAGLASSAIIVATTLRTPSAAQVAAAEARRGE